MDLDNIIVLTNNIIKTIINVKDMKSLTNPSLKTIMAMDRHLDMCIETSLLVLLVDMIIVEMMLEDMPIVVLRHRLDIGRQDHVMIGPDHLIEDHPLNRVDINLNKTRENLCNLIIFLCFFYQCSFLKLAAQ